MKKRYYTSNQIRDDIDKWKRKIQKLMDSASSHDLIADQMSQGGLLHSEHIIWQREKAKKLRASALRLERRKLIHLKNKLAEFMTPQIPSIDNQDRSVPR